MCHNQNQKSIQKMASSLHPTARAPLNSYSDSIWFQSEYKIGNVKCVYHAEGNRYTYFTIQITWKELVFCGFFCENAVKQYVPESVNRNTPLVFSYVLLRTLIASELTLVKKILYK